MQEPRLRRFEAQPVRIPCTTPVLASNASMQEDARTRFSDRTHAGEMSVI